MPHLVQTMRGPKVGTATCLPSDRHSVQPGAGTRHMERAHAEPAHVAKRHGLDRVIRIGGSHHQLRRLISYPAQAITARSRA
jgi:hypothetical protein